MQRTVLAITSSSLINVRQTELTLY